MKCPNCGEKVYLREDRIFMHTTEYAPKVKSIGFVKTPIRKRLDTTGNGTYPFSLFCKNCNYNKTIDDDLSEEECILIDWIDENMVEDK